MPNERLVSQVEELEKDRKEENKKKKPKAWKYILNISFVLIATSLAFFFSIKDNAKETLTYLARCKIEWLFAVAGMVTFMICIRSFILFCFARLYSRTYKYHQAIAVDQIGIFYNAITPGASGGQIMQAYTYKKQGVQVSSAVSIMAMYSIVYQSVLIIFGIISFIVKYDFITSLGEIDTAIKIADMPLKLPIWPLTIIGFILNVSVILVVLLMGYWHGFHNFIMGPCVSLLAKIKLVKKPDKMRENLRIQVENFKIEFRRLFTNVRFTLLVVFCFSLYMIAKFSIPYFVGQALGNVSPQASFWDSIFLSNYHQMVTGLIPLPGSAGVSEFFFYQLFLNNNDPTKGFFYEQAETLIDSISASRSMTRAALIIWRTATFSVPIVLAGFVAAFYKSSPKNEAHLHGDMPNRETFVALQNETFIQRQAEVINAEETNRLSRSAVIQRLKSFNKKKDVDKPLSDSQYDNVNISGFDDEIEEKQTVSKRPITKKKDRYK